MQLNVVFKPFLSHSFNLNVHFVPKSCVWNRKITRENEILQHLPMTLQTATAVSVHLPTLSKVTIFQNCENSLLEQLVLKLTPQVRKQVAHLDSFKPADLRLACFTLPQQCFIMFAVASIGLYILPVNHTVSYSSLLNFCRCTARVSTCARRAMQVMRCTSLKRGSWQWLQMMESLSLQSSGMETSLEKLAS